MAQSKKHYRTADLTAACGLYSGAKGNTIALASKYAERSRARLRA